MMPMPHNYAATASRDPDTEDEVSIDRNDRDARVLRHVTQKGSTRRTLEPKTPGGHRDTAWGGAMRNMSEIHTGPAREDELRAGAVPGRYVPIGFARYVAPLVDPSDYEFYRVAGWRVAVPRTTSGLRVKELLYRIFYYGPQSAGYVRLGDSLVPAILSPGDRMTIAQSAFDFEAYPLGP